MASPGFDELLVRVSTDRAFGTAVATDPDATLSGYALTDEERRRLATVVEGESPTARELSPRLSKSSVLLMSSGAAALTAGEHLQVESTASEHISISALHGSPALEHQPDSFAVAHVAPQQFFGERSAVLHDVQHVTSAHEATQHDQAALVDAQAKVHADQQQIDSLHSQIAHEKRYLELVQDNRSKDGTFIGQMSNAFNPDEVEGDDHDIGQALGDLDHLHAQLDDAEAQLDHDQGVADSLTDQLSTDHAHLQAGILHLDQDMTAFERADGHLADPATLELLGQTDDTHALDSVQVDVDHLLADEHRHVGDIGAVDLAKVDADLADLDTDWGQVS